MSHTCIDHINHRMDECAVCLKAERDYWRNQCYEARKASGKYNSLWTKLKLRYSRDIEKQAKIIEQLSKESGDFGTAWNDRMDQLGAKRGTVEDLRSI